jgi:tRNA(fMet)-specific endonuclease VapC
MSLLLVDTAFLVDAERDADAWAGVIDDADDVAIAAVTVADLLVGVALASKRHRPARAAFVGEVMTTIPVLDYDVDVAAAHAELLAAVRRSGRPRAAHDLIIAATARATRRTVVTTDTSGFEDLPGVAVVGPVGP